MKLLVTFKSFQKRVEVIDGLDLQETINEAFCPGGFPTYYQFQYFCRDFDAFVDLDDLNILKDRLKIRVMSINNDHHLENIYENEIAENRGECDDRNETREIVVENSESVFEPHTSFSFEITSSIDNALDTPIFQRWSCPFLLKDECLPRLIVLKMHKK